MSDPYPDVDPADHWTETTRERTVLADPGPTTVTGSTVVYEDRDLADAFGDVDGPAPTRFAFATALSFDPGLAPGLGVATVRPTVVQSADGAFADRLRERGLSAVERGRRDRLRTDTDDRARLRRFTAEYRPTESAAEPPVAIEGFLAVWTVDGQFRVAGGAYPTSELPDDPRVGSPGEYREDLLSFLRGVA